MSNLGPESRALLDEGREALRPGAVDRERILSTLQARMGGLPPEPLAEPATATSGALGWPAISALAIGLAFGGGLLLHRYSTEPPPAPGPSKPSDSIPAPAPAPTSVPAPEAEASPAAPLPEPAPSVERRPAAPSRPADHLAQEVALLSRAQKELHAGRFTAALGLLGEHQRKFPRGTLAQERVAARIQALCGLGRNAEADAELARVSPGSLHAGRAREACASKAK